MKNLFTTLIFLLITTAIFSQHVTRTITWDGTERQYLEYVPTIYDPGTPAPVVFCLHGLGDNMTNFATIGFDQVADLTGWIVITPQALVATAPIIGDIGTAWNSGAGAMGTPLGDVILNENVDDTGFLTFILDSLQNNYNINTDSVFFMGFSMGGFMCNRLASEIGSRITAVASVSGTMGVAFTPDPLVPINTLHIHGTADTQIRYEDAGFDPGTGTYYSVGMGAEELVNYWRNYNVCDAEPVVTLFPDTQVDGKTFERYLYLNGTNGVQTAFIKVIGGDHEWYFTPQNDIDYTTEIYKFFTNTMDFPSSCPTIAAQNGINVFPNPAQNIVKVDISEPNNATLAIFNILGEKITEMNLENSSNLVNVEDIPAGIYFFNVTNGNETFEHKMIIQK
jgi:polyhydroxybutyrate depolymerase